MTRPVIVGITGASGIVYGVRALQLLRECEVPTHLVMSKSAELTLHYELDMSTAQLQSLATEVHPVKNVGASIASGSFPTAGMLIAPCSVRTMSEIATGVTSTLLTRAADVVLKERRRLVLMVRETPLHTGHLRTMTQLSEIGAVIAPPVPAFYARPDTLDGMVTQTVGRALDLFDLELAQVQRWQGDSSGQLADSGGANEAQRLVPILFGVIVLDLIGFGIVIPILPFLSPKLGADKMDIALIIVSYAVCAGISGPFWGRLSDRIGRKPVIMICLAGAAVSYVMLGLAGQLWMVYAARAFAGLMAGNFGVASAMMADITTPRNRARGMGLIGAAFGLGIVLGPILGGLLSGDSASFTLPCIVAGGMSVLAVVAAACFLPESLPPEKRSHHREGQSPDSKLSNYGLLRQTGNRLFALQYVLHNASVSTITYIFPLWMGDMLGWGAREVGIVFGIQGVLMIIFQAGLLGPMVRMLGEWRVLRCSVFCFLVGVLHAVFAGTMHGMVGSMFLAMTGATLCMPLLNTIISHRIGLEYRGRMLGITSAASSWGRVVGPLMAGVNLELFGYRGAWLGAGVIVLFYLLWAITGNRGQPARIAGDDVQPDG